MDVGKSFLLINIADIKSAGLSIGDDGVNKRIFQKQI
jgi:hypothetical protein